MSLVKHFLFALDGLPAVSKLGCPGASGQTQYGPLWAKTSLIPKTRNAIYKNMLIKKTMSNLLSVV